MDIEYLLLSPELISKIYIDSHLGLDLILFEIPNGTGTLPLDWMVGIPPYYAATTYATFGILYATAIEQFKLWKWNLIEAARNGEENINLINHFQMYPPLPHKYMVMQGVQLHDECFGFLRKLGFLFMGVL